MIRKRIRFDFSLDKLLDVLAYFAEVGRIHDLTKLKAAKLLYFADKAHLLRYGRPIIGDRYVGMDQGPVPSESLNVMNQVVAPDEFDDPVRRRVSERLSVHKWLMSSHPSFRVKRHGQPFDHLSASEREVLDEVITTYGHKPAGELIELTHREHAWRVSDKSRPQGSSVPMPYETFFEGEHTSDADAMRRFVEAQQDDRDFISSILR